MNLSELELMVRGRITDTTLAVRVGDVGSLAVDDLLASNFTDGVLVVTSATLEVRPGQVTVRGRAKLFGTTEAIVLVIFSLDGPTPQVRVDGSLSDYAFLDAAGDVADPLLAELRFTDARYTLLSQGQDGLPAGVTFAGNCALPAHLRPLAWLWGGASEMGLSGTVHWASGLPSLNLAGPRMGAVTIDTFGLDPVVTLRSELFTAGVGADAVFVRASLALESAWTLDVGTGTRQIQLAMRLPRGDRWGLLSFDTVLDGMSFGDLARLGLAICGAPLCLPPGIPAADAFELSAFTLVFSTRDRSIVSAALRVASIRRWELIPDELSLDVVECSFTILSPFLPEQRKIFTTVHGDLKVHESVDLEMTWSYPGLVTAAIADGSEVSLRQVVALFFPHTDLPEIEIVELRLALDLETRCFDMEIEATGEWALPVGDISQPLGEIAVSLHRTPGGVNGMVQGTAAVAGATLYLAAAHPAEGAGWTFTGRAEGGQPMRLAALAEELAELFDTPVPEQTPDIAIESLEMRVDTAAKAWQFGATANLTGEMPLASIRVHVEVTLDSYLDAQTGARAFTADFDGSVSMARILGDPLSDVPVSMRLATSTRPSPASRESSCVLTATSPDYGNAVIVIASTGAAREYFFGLAIDTPIDLADLPLVRMALPAGAITVHDVRLSASSDGIRSVAESTNASIPPGFPTIPAEAPEAPVSLSMIVELPDLVVPMRAPAVVRDAPRPDAGATPSPGEPSTPPPDPITWHDARRSLGPVTLSRIGTRYTDGHLWFYLDASLGTSTLTLTLDGLAAGVSLADLAERTVRPTFQLRGLGLAYADEAMTLAGSLLRGQGDTYDGLATLSMEGLTLAAVGSYAANDSDPSLFVYAILDRALGGPSFFFVTGLAAGFGYNRALVVPAIDQIATFPLVTEAQAGSASMPAPDKQQEFLQTRLDRLRASVPPSAGEHFAALGVRFTSFRQVESFALLVVRSGPPVEVDVLGLSTAIVPSPQGGRVGEPIAEVQMALRATYRPSVGSLEVRGQLTPASYVFSRACHLTGGFAFSSWFTGDHAGDFVLSLGGYHPGFRPPAHYPLVPRLAFAWQVNPELSVHGDAYVALAPHVLMAGCHLQAVWESGNVRAWFNAAADFLLSWKPYHYQASLSIEMGVSYTFHFFGTHHINVDIGARLEVWGPDFSGVAEIELWCVSFTVSFGAARAVPPTLTWCEFSSSFLPPAESVASLAPTAGLLCQLGRLWVMNPRELSISAQSFVPSTSGTCGEGAEKGIPFGIAPMNLSSDNVKATLSVTITRNGEDVTSAFAYTPILKKAPRSLWGSSTSASAASTAFIGDALHGFDMRPGIPAVPGRTHAIPRENLQYDTVYPKGERPGTPTVLASPPRAFVPDTKQEWPTDTAATMSGRKAMLAALGLDVPPADVGPRTAGHFLFPPTTGVLSPPTTAAVS